MSLNVGARFNYYGHSTFLITTDGGVDLLLDPWVWLPDRSAGGMDNPSCPEGYQPIERLANTPSFGVWVRAIQTRMDRPVLLKLLPPGLPVPEQYRLEPLAC